MAYTRTWDETTPAGSRAANQIDDAIRELKVDVRERMNSVFVDFTTDPVVFLPQFGGAATGLTVVVGPAGMKSANDEDDVFTNGQYVSGDSGKHQYQEVTKYIPPNVTITKVEFLLDKNGAASVTAELKRCQFDPASGITSVSGVITRAVAGIGIAASGVLGFATVDIDVWFVDFYGPVGSTPHYHGMRVTYDRA